MILVRGSTGVGKTLTAEVVSEYVKRPLYTISIGEIGVDLSRIENNLGTIFKRASRWNAILLLDEADIFLTRRDENIEFLG